MLNVNEIIKNPQVIELAEKIREYGIDVSLLNEEQVDDLMELYLLSIR